MSSSTYAYWYLCLLVDNAYKSLAQLTRAARATGSGRDGLHYACLYVSVSVCLYVCISLYVIMHYLMHRRVFVT